MAVKFTNNAATTLAAGINSSVTSISVTDGSVFPALTGSDHFYVTFDDTTNREIVKVTARSGNTLTVVRGQDNTTAQAFNSGDKAELRVVAALLEDITTEVTSTLSVDTFTGDGTTTAFTLSQAPSSEDNLIVFIEGAYQNPGDFVLSGTTLTLDEAPVVDRNIIVYHVKGAVSGNNLNQDSFTADGNTAAFTLSIAPIHENNTQVFIDGVYQQKNSYSISGTTLTLDANPSNGATVEVMTFTQTDVNTLPASFVSGLTEVTAVGADHFMIFDATDSALKKSLVSDVLESATSISTSADATAITIDSSENVTFTNNVTINSGQLTAGGLAYPTSDGTNGQVLTTDGAGTLSFSTVSGTTINNNADNRIITGSGTANTLNGDANFTYNGTTFALGGTSSNKSVAIESATGNKGFLSAWQDTAMFGINRDPATGTMTQTGRASALVKLESYNADAYITFQTSTTNNAEPTERMRITSNGALRHTQSGYTFDNGFRQGDGTNYWQSTMGGDNAYYFGSYNGGSGARIDPSTGDFRLQGGIQFNADSAAANLLDDYEEGTWTPTLTASISNPSVTYVSPYTQGRYTKIGNIVHVDFEIRYVVRSGGSGSALISGLPFTRLNGYPDGDKAGGLDFYGVSFPTPNITFAYLSLGTNETRMSMGFNRSATTPVTLAIGNVGLVSGLGYIRGNMTYRVS